MKPRNTNSSPTLIYSGEKSVDNDRQNSNIQDTTNARHANDIKQADRVQQERAVNNGEKERQISEVLRRRMGELATKTVDMEGLGIGHSDNGTQGDGGDLGTNIIIAEKNKTDIANAVNEAVSQKMSKGIIGKVPVLRNFVAAAYRMYAADAVKKAGGDINSAFKALKLDSGKLMNKNSSEYTQLRARLALEDSGFTEDKVDASNSFRLNEGEKIEKVKDERQEKVTTALKDLFENLEKAKKHGDKEEYNLAKKEYLDKVDAWQNEGLFGERQSNLGRKILESKIATFLIGDHSKKSMTELDGLRKMADGVDDLVNEKVAQDDFNSYVDNHLSLYNASMKEGIYTKQKVDNLTAAVAAGGLVGAVAYSLLGRGRSSAKQAVSAEVAKESAKAMSNAAMGAVVGGAFGAAAGAVRGFNRARVNLSKAETEAALSGEEIVTPAEKEARKIKVTEASDETETDRSSEQKIEEKDKEIKKSENVEQTDEGEKPEIKFSDLTHKQRIAAVMGKINNFKKMITGETKNEDKIEKALERKSAKEFYDELNEKLAKITELDGDSKERKELIEQLMESVADVRARNKVSAEKKIDLISYSRGNVERERMLLGEKMAEAQKLIGNKNDKFDNLVARKVESYIDANNKANKARANYIARQAVVDLVIGGTIGSISGALAGRMKDVREAKAAALVGNDDDNTNVVDDAQANGADEVGSANDEVEERVKNSFSVEDRDGDGVFAVYDSKGNAIISEEEGLHFEANGKISESDLQLLRDNGVNIQEFETVTEVPGGYSRVGIDNYFSKNSENYVDNLGARAGDVEAANTVVGVERVSWIATGDGDRAADVIVDSTPINEGDIVLRVVPKDSSINVDDLQVALTPSREIGDMGIVLDVAEDGTVTLPAGSVAASMFTDGAGGFAGGAIEVVRESANGNGFDVLATSFGSNSLEEVGFSGVVEKVSYSYTVDGAEFNIPDEVMVEANVDLVGVESLRDSGPVEYTTGQTEITVNGLGSGDATETITVPYREGNYSEINDPFFSEYKESPALNSYNMVQRLVDPDMEMTGQEANAALMEAVNNGEISTGQVVNAYLEQMGNSPEQIVEMRAMLGDLQFDIDGDGTTELIDTDWEVNAVADILKNSAEEDGYGAFVNDTYALLYEKMDGGEIRLINYAEEPYEYTTLGYLDKMNNVIHQFARKRSACSGIGIEFLDKDGRSVYDLDIAKRIWKMPANANLERVTERLNCGQKTADVNWIEQANTTKVQPESTKTEPESTKTQPESTKTEPESTKTQPEGTKTGSEKTGNEKTGNEGTEEKIGTEKTGREKTEGEKTEGEKTEGEKTEGEKTEGEKTEGEGTWGKTDTNPWEDNDATPMPETPSFEDESAANGGGELVQEGQEQVPPADTSGVNDNPADAQDWAEQPTPPTPDLGLNPEDQSASSDAAAAAALAEAEAALRESMGGGS